VTTPPELRHVLHLDVGVGAPVEVGPTSAGLRRLVPITGGTASGPLLQGRIVPGGWDDQLARSETETEVEARYVIETDRSELVYVTNRGLRTGTADDVARLLRDESVDPSRIYFRSSPTFETSAERLSALTTRLFVGVGTRHPRSVVFDFFEVG
jgi:hypothetical protein